MLTCTEQIFQGVVKVRIHRQYSRSQTYIFVVTQKIFYNEGPPYNNFVFKTAVLNKKITHTY